MFSVPAFREHLTQQDRAALTLIGYERDLALFAQWFKERNGEPLTPAALTATDAREYRQYLLSTAQLGPATINRRLAALRAYGAWAASVQLDSNPVAHIKMWPNRNTARAGSRASNRPRSCAPPKRPRALPAPPPPASKPNATRRS